MSQAASRYDPLLKEVEDIRAFLEARKIQIFFALLSDYKGGEVYWNHERGGDWKSFLAVAESMGAKGVYLNWEPFEQAQVTEAITRAEAL